MWDVFTKQNRHDRLIGSRVLDQRHVTVPRVCMITTLVLFTLSVTAEIRAPMSLRNPGDAVFQFWAKTSYAFGPGTNRTAEAYLWIPPAVQSLRALVVMGQNVPEQWIAEHPAFRAFCAEQRIAILWMCPSVLEWRVVDGRKHSAFIQSLLDPLARQSGYDELTRIPWIPMGESMHIHLVKYVIADVPERCLAGIILKDFHDHIEQTEVPVLTVVGTCGEWNQKGKDLTTKWREKAQTTQKLCAMRMRNPQFAGSLLLEPGSGHFEVTEESLHYIMTYLREIIPLRLTASGLQPVDLHCGWVCRLAAPQDRGSEPKAYDRASEQERCWPWYATRQQALDAYRASDVNWDAQTQVTAVLDATGQRYPFGGRGILEAFDIVPDAQGECVLDGGYWEQMPDDFTKMTGRRLPHLQEKPFVEWICGSFEPTQVPYHFRMALDRSWGNSAIFIRAWHPGNAHYRYMVQAAEIRFKQNQRGKSQSILFSPLRMTQNGCTVQATASSGLPVRFYVKYGPGYVAGTTLSLVECPARSRLPIPLCVVAWQLGDDRYASAPCVEQIIMVPATSTHENR